MSQEICPACDAKILLVDGHRQGGTKEVFDPQPSTGPRHNTRLSADLTHIATPAASAGNLIGRMPLYRPHRYSCPNGLKVRPPRSCPSWGGYSQAAAARKDAAGAELAVPGWPQPWAGIRGVPREDSDLLSLDPEAMPRRRLMATMALNLYHATLTGQLSPSAVQMGRRVREPRPGDLVVEVTTARKPGSERRGFGVLLAKRREWVSAEAEIARLMDDGAGDFPDEVRGDGGAGEVWYVQFGPAAKDIARWERCDWVAALADDREDER